MKRGELWTLAVGPDYAGKPRPAVIVQDDRWDATDSVAVCLLTTIEAPIPIARPAVDPTVGNGLRERSMVMVDKLSAVPRRRLGVRMGVLGDAVMSEVNDALLLFLGLGVSTVGAGRHGA